MTLPTLCVETAYKMPIHEQRLGVLRELYKSYPIRVQFQALQSHLSIARDDLTRVLIYLDEKGLVSLDSAHMIGHNMPTVFTAMLTANGVDLVETPSFLEYAKEALERGQELPTDRKQEILDYVEKLGIPLLAELMKILLGL